MPVTVDEVRNVISESFPGANVDQVIEKNHRIGGVIVWEEFKGKDVAERNRMVSERVRDRFGLRGMNIGLLFPLAPGEKL